MTILLILLWASLLFLLLFKAADWAESWACGGMAESWSWWIVRKAPRMAYWDVLEKTMSSTGYR